MDSGSSFLRLVATAWESNGEYIQLGLALLFGWLVLNWLSTTTARVDGLSIAMRDLRRDLDEVKGSLKTKPGDHRPGGQ
jgi:hypothetical protein